MKQILIAILYLSPFGLLAQLNCSNAQVITNGTHSVAFAGGSQIPIPICTTGLNNNTTMGAWFAYTPSQLCTAAVSTIDSYRDTRVHIYKGDCGSLVCVAGDDDSGGVNQTSFVVFTAEAGVTYYIAFDNNWDDYTFSFSLMEGAFVEPPFTVEYINIEGKKYCVADMNGDHLDDIVAPYILDAFGQNVVNILYQTIDGNGFNAATLTAPDMETDYHPSWSIAAGDYNNDGYNDLLYGGQGGAMVLLANSAGTAFDTQIRTQQFVFSQRTNFVDIDNDGNLDAFVCHDTGPNFFLINDGNEGGIWKQSGVNGAPDLGVYTTGGDYGSIWVDYDNDGDQDLYIAKCRGANDNAAKDELHRNNGDGTFTNVAEELGFADYHQSWSSAWADFDNDGDMDVLVGGHAAPSQTANVQSKLMRNNGDGTFTNITPGSGYDNLNTASREYHAHDFDNDGFVDIIGGGNIIMYNNGDLSFTPVIVQFTPGPVGDLNNDGFLDVLNDNKIYLGNDNGNNWLKVCLQGVDSNRNGIGARIEVYTTDTEKQVREIRSGDGFRYMSTLNAHFGLGDAEAIDHVVVKWPSGVIDVIDGLSINQRILIVEGIGLGTNAMNKSLFSLYPNPAKDVLNISGDLDIASANVYDLSGRLVRSIEVTNAMVPVQQLAKGSYIIILHDTAGKQYSSKFIKE